MRKHYPGEQHVIREYGIRWVEPVDIMDQVTAVGGNLHRAQELLSMCHDNKGELIVRSVTYGEWKGM